MQKFRTLFILLIIAVLLAGVVLFFKWDMEVSGKKKHRVAIQGYDTVSFFTSHKAEMGSEQHQYYWNKLLWRFTSNQHLQLFKNVPAKFAPQFGGNCAFTTSLGKEQMGLAKHWIIINKKLYLNSNLMAQFLWKMFPSLIPEAEKQWNELIRAKAVVEIDEDEGEEASPGLEK